MAALKPVLAWGVAAGAFAAAAAAILATRPMYIAKATAEISRTEISSKGLADFSRVEISGTNRMLPMEMVARVRSHGTIRRALQALKLPADEAAVEEAAGRIGVRLVGGTTLIETDVRATSKTQAPALAAALFTAHEAIRRERRAALTDSLIDSMTAAAAALQKESQTVAGGIAEMELQRPVRDGGGAELDRAFVDLASEKARIRSTLQRLEAIESADPERQVRELDDVARSETGDQPFAGQAGYAVLRAGIADRLGELARRRAQHGENSAPVQSARAALAALHDSLRGYLAGQVVQLRGRLRAMESAGEMIDARGTARQDRSRAVQVSLVSPEAEALLIRRDAIRAQLAKLEIRRRELLIYKEAYEPSLVPLDEPSVSDSPEVALRSARLVLAGFGALLVGFSLSIIFDRRAAAVL